MYQHNLYGDAARGCHHRGDGPDASQRDISHNRQCLGDLIEEASRQNPLGYIGGACRRNRRRRFTKGSSPPNQWNLGSESLAKEVKNDGKEEGRQEAGSQEEGRQEEEVVSTSSFVF